MGIEAQVLLFVQEHIRSAFLDPIMHFFTLIGEAGIVWIVLGLLLLLHPKTRKGGFFMLLCLLAGFLLNNILIKNLIQRPRPYVTIPALISAVGEVSEWSFPSGHTCSSFTCATALALSFGKKGALAFIPALLISLSRIYVGVHYPSDIICGALLGALVAVSMYYLLKRLFRTDKKAA
jgi:Membrane-associated phospholipid phosphatase